MDTNCTNVVLIKLGALVIVVLSLQNLTDYLAYLSVLRHRVISIDTKKLRSLLWDARWMQDPSEADAVLFPLFDDAQLHVKFTHAYSLVRGMQAEFRIVSSDNPSEFRTSDRGTLTLNTETGAVMAVFWVGGRHFALHFSGESPYHVAVESDPNSLPSE